MSGTLTIGRREVECDLVFGDNDERRCVWCGTELTKRRVRWCSDEHGRAWSANHSWTDARKAALRRDGYACTTCGSSERLEVNHITPVMGKHNQPGCHHHLDGLETLCHDCHAVITAAQAADRASKRREMSTSSVGLGDTRQEPENG